MTSKSLIRILMSVALAVCSAGCNQVMSMSNALVGAPTYPPSDPAAVQILRQKPDRPYAELAEVFIEPQGGNPPTATIEAALRKQAARYGADAALITMDRIEQSGTEYTGGGQFATMYGHAVRALAIKFTK